MMEEIDRFQVPTAHSEMQPLVRGRAAGRPGPGGAPPEGREGTRPWGLCEGAPSDKVEGVLKTLCRGGRLAERENRGRLPAVGAKDLEGRRARSADAERHPIGPREALYCTPLVEANLGGCLSQSIFGSRPQGSG